MTRLSKNEWSHSILLYLKYQYLKLNITELIVLFHRPVSLQRWGGTGSSFPLQSVKDKSNMLRYCWQKSVGGYSVFTGGCSYCTYCTELCFMQCLRLNFKLNSWNWCICFNIHFRWNTSGEIGINKICSTNVMFKLGKNGYKLKIGPNKDW